jgi:3-phosphoshikimate 1-carboxyvinyltransferase
MTLSAMRACGVEVVQVEGARFVIPASQRYQAAAIAIEPDASAATYFWAAAAITGGRVRVCGLSRASLQGDVNFVDVLAAMGCAVQRDDDSITVCGPPMEQLRGVEVDLNAMPDTAQTLAVAAVFANSPTTIRNVANLRVKETDRIAALERELSKLGATVTTCADGLTITPATSPRAATIETHEDHRMAMSFALAGLRLNGVVIREADCVAKSFPGYFDAMNTL